MERNLYHFYHLFADGKWVEPVNDHFRAMRMSNLLDHMTKIYVGMVGSEENIKKASDYLTRLQIPFEICTTEPRGYEQVTLNMLSDFSKDNDGHVLYGHSKGAGFPVAISTAWRKSMIWYTIIQWRECVGKLNEGYNTVGSHWFHQGGPEHHRYPFWGGTYWWAKLEDLRVLDRPTNNSRYDAEHWIGMLTDHMHVRAFDMNPMPISPQYLKQDW